MIPGSSSGFAEISELAAAVATLAAWRGSDGNEGFGWVLKMSLIF